METTKIGNKIAEARKKINISQAQLAQHLFISPQAVGKWERGESLPDIIMLNRLAQILGTDLNYFSDDFPLQHAETATEKPVPEQKETKLHGKNMNKPAWDMSLGNWVEADFSGLKNLKDKFANSNMKNCKFVGSEMTGLLLKNNNVDSCDFSDSDISDSHIQRSNLANNLFRGCLLKDMEIVESNVNRCDFFHADMREMQFSKSFVYGCQLSGADFTGVIFKSGGFTGEKSKDLEKNTITETTWNRASFIDTIVADIVFTGIIEDCCFENCKFTRVIFRDATLINTFFKNNKKLKQIQFINCKADRMTYEFLKNGKANLEGIIMLTR